MLSLRGSADSLGLRGRGRGAPTVILSTHTGGFEGFAAREMTEEMRTFAAHWRSIGVKFDCIYTGFFFRLGGAD